MSIRRYTASAIIAIALALAIFAIACGGSPAEPTAMPAATGEASRLLAPTTGAESPPSDATAAPAATAMPADTAAPPATKAMTTAETEPPAPSPTAASEPAPTGGLAVFTLSDATIARYKVEEELANTGFYVATGETTDVAGAIAFDAAGAVVAEQSRITVQAATLQTDSNRRDGYVRSRTLETDTYPEVVFVPTAVDGLPQSIADASGDAAFTITGDLTVKDQTREVTWDATANFAGDGAASGTASVEFTFDDFGMDKPRVAIVLSVEDTIRLELDFVGTITAR